MNSFLKYYFAGKLILFVLFFIMNYYNSTLFSWYAIIDFIVVPIWYILASAIRKRKLRAGEYVVKPEGKRL